MSYDIYDGNTLLAINRPRPGVLTLANGATAMPPTDEQLRETGWLAQVHDATPEGMQRVAGTDTHTRDGDVSRVTWEFEAIPVVEVYPSPDVTVPVLDADGNATGTARILADADLNIVAVVDSASPQRPWAEQLEQWQARRVRERIERASLRAAARRAVATDPDALTPEDAAELAGIFEAWRAGEAVTAGMVREFAGMLYKVIQPHTTQADWTPDVTPALWARIAAPDAGPEPWVQPYGGSGTYESGAIVTHNGQTWRNIVPAPTLNVWEPGVYGWEVVQ